MRPWLALRANDLAAARARFSRALKICRDAQDKRGEAIARWRLGKTDAAGGDHEAAGRELIEALRALRAFEMHTEAFDCLEDCARLLQTLNRSEDAVGVFAAASAARELLALPRSARREGERQESIEAARTALGKSAFDAAWLSGTRWTVDEAIACVGTSASVTPVSA